jgi:predicted permease
MPLVLSVTVPFFALVLLGWLAARLGRLPESAIPGLNAYVLWFALPCMLFRFGSSLPLASLADPWLLGLYLAVAIALVAFTVAVTRRSTRRPGGVAMKDAGLGALVAAFPERRLHGGAAARSPCSGRRRPGR